MAICTLSKPTYTLSKACYAVSKAVRQLSKAAYTLSKPGDTLSKAVFEVSSPACRVSMTVSKLSKVTGRVSKRGLPLVQATHLSAKLNVARLYAFAELFRPNFSDGSLNLNLDSPALEQDAGDARAVRAHGGNPVSGQTSTAA